MADECEQHQLTREVREHRLKTGSPGEFAPQRGMQQGNREDRK